MSKQNNLTDFLTDVANAIRAKKGSTDLINPQNFSSEIASLSGGLEIVDMTETTATIEPNKVYVWGMVASLDITLGASTDESDFFAFRFRCSKPTMTSLTVNGAIWAEDTELDAQGKPILDLGSYYQCEIKGGTSALYARLAHYIPFEDSNVEAVLLAKGVGDGLGVTYKDAAKVTSISTWFKDNGVITSFDELKYFTNITTLGASAFINCLNLVKVNLDNIVKLTGHDGAGAFYNSGIKEVSLPKLSVIENSYSCEFQKSLVERILSLGKITTIPNGNANYGFCRNCTLLTYVNLPDTLTSIGNFAFSRCSSLSQINLPASLTSLGESAFAGCTSLEKITLPAGVTNIRGAVFYNDTSLQYIRIEATTPPTLASTNAIPSTIGAIYVPDESVAAYQAATNWSNFASKIKGISEMPA